MPGDLRISMLFKAETGQAQGAIVGLKTSADDLSASIVRAGQGAAGSSTSIAAAGAAGEATSSDFLKVVSSATALDGVIQRLSGSMGRLRAPETALGTFAALGDRSLGIDELAADWRLATEEAQRYQAALDQVRASYNPLFAVSRQYEQQLRQIDEAEGMNAISARETAAARDRAAQALAPMPGHIARVGASSQAAAAHMAQLGYQFNDIGMMLAAGQSPFMLMMQQGPQVTQVFDNMKASGMSVGASIKSALLNMVSPMNLVTMGAIALGAYAVQALMNMGEETKSAEDAVKDLSSSVGEFRENSRRSVADIVADFGTINPALIEMQRNLTTLSETSARLDLKAAFAALKGEVAGGWFESARGATSDLLGVSPYKTGIASGRGGAQTENPVVTQFRSSLNDLQTAAGSTAQLEIVRGIAAQLVTAAGGIDRMTLAQSEFYGQLLASETALTRIVAAQAEARKQQLEMKRATGVENDRMGGPTALDRAAGPDPDTVAKGRTAAAALIETGGKELEIVRLKLVYGEQSVQVRQEEERQARATLEAEIARLGIDRQGLQAQQMRGQLALKLSLEEATRLASQRQSVLDQTAAYQQQARIVALTAQYGADSLEVAYARAGAEREAQVAMLAAQGVSGDLADDLMASWDAARGVASINMAAGIGAAAAEAQLLASLMGISLQHSLGLMGLANGARKAAASSKVSFGGASAAEGLGGGATLGFGDNPGSASVTIPAISTGAGRAAGGGAAAKEASALRRLIEEQNRQIAVLRELDPVQREILENHEALKDATEGERQKVADLIAERQRLELIRDRIAEIGQVGQQAFVGLVTGAHGLRDALGMVIEKLAEMAASSAWDALLGGMGGGNALGGLFGFLFSGASSTGAGNLGLPLFADGGRIQGAGGPREDNHTVRVSAGEYIINAAATSANLPLIDAINAGARPQDLLELLASQTAEAVGTNPLQHLLGQGVALPRLVDAVMPPSSRPAFADGGLIGTSAPRAWRSAGATGGAQIASGGTSSGSGSVLVDLRVSIDQNGNLRALIDQRSEGVAVRVVQQGMEQFSSNVLPGRVAEISRDPLRVGG